MLYGLYGRLRSGLLSRNRYLWCHLTLMVLFGLLYRFMSWYGLLSGREGSDMSSLGSSLYHSVMTQFTIAPLNNPGSGLLRSVAVVQVLIAFIFLNL